MVLAVLVSLARFERRGIAASTGEDPAIFATKPVARVCTPASQLSSHENN